MSTYRKLQERAREKAVEWQSDFDNHNYSYDELIYWQSYFEKLGRRYGLVREFRDNCII